MRKLVLRKGKRLPSSRRKKKRRFVKKGKRRPAKKEKGHLEREKK